MSLSSGPSKTIAPSSNFKSMLDAALAEYKKKTGNDLLAHWLANELKTCESVDAVMDILRDQAKGFGKAGDQKLMGWIDPLVHVLHTFSDALGDGVSLVHIASLMHNDLKRILTLLQGFPSCESYLYGYRCPSRSPCSRYSFS